MLDPLARSLFALISHDIHRGCFSIFVYTVEVVWMWRRVIYCHLCALYVTNHSQSSTCLTETRTHAVNRCPCILDWKIVRSIWFSLLQFLSKLGRGIIDLFEGNPFWHNDFCIKMKVFFPSNLDDYFCSHLLPSSLKNSIACFFIVVWLL